MVLGDEKYMKNDKNIQQCTVHEESLKHNHFLGEFESRKTKQSIDAKIA